MGRRRDAITSFFNDTENLVGTVSEVKDRLEQQVPELKFATSKFFSGVDFEDAIVSMQGQMKASAQLAKESQSFINQSFRTSSIDGQFSGEKLGRSQQLVNRMNTNQSEVAVFDEQIKLIQNNSSLSESEKQQQLRIPTAQRDALSGSVDRAEAELVNTLNNIVQNSDQLSPSLKNLITSLPTAQAVELARGLTNAGAEIERLQKRFELINLGLSPFNANAVSYTHLRAHET